MQAMLSIKGDRGCVKGWESVEWLQKKSWRGTAWGEVGSDYLYASLRLLWYATVSMEVFTPTKCAAQGLKAVKFSTSEFSSCRTCQEHYFCIWCNNNSKETAGSERLSALLEVTQEGPPASSLPLHMLPPGVQISLLQVAYFLQQIPSNSNMAVDTFFFCFYFSPCGQNKAFFKKAWDIVNTQSTESTSLGLGVFSRSPKKVTMVFSGCGGNWAQLTPGSKLLWQGQMCSWSPGEDRLLPNGLEVLEHRILSMIRAVSGADALCLLRKASWGPATCSAHHLWLDSEAEAGMCLAGQWSTLHLQAQGMRV